MPESRALKSSPHPPTHPSASAPSATPSAAHGRASAASDAAAVKQPSKASHQSTTGTVVAPSSKGGVDRPPPTSAAAQDDEGPMALATAVNAESVAEFLGFSFGLSSSLTPISSSSRCAKMAEKWDKKRRHQPRLRRSRGLCIRMDGQNVIGGGDHWSTGTLFYWERFPVQMEIDRLTQHVISFRLIWNWP